MIRLHVTKKENEIKLNTYLLEKLDGLTLNLLYKTLRKKDIRVNGKRISQNILLQEGDTIDVYITDTLLSNKKEIPIVYEDSNILIANKPSQLEVTGQHSLTSLLKEQCHCPNLSPCHRLDRNTLGLVLFAKNETSLAILLNAFKHHEIEKHYACHVYGIPKEKTKTLVAYLFKDAKKAQVYVSDVPKKGYQKIVTSYSILETYSDDTCLLDINLLTGKTHQIRAHLAHIGYPIIGDGKYGKNEINKQYKAKTQQLCSYQMKFNFTNTTNVLAYLSKKDITISCPFHF